MKPPFLLVAVLLLACADARQEGADSAVVRSPGDEAREIAVAVDRAAPKLARRDWTGRMGDASASLSSFREGDALRLIRERLDRGDQGVASNRYYFADGRLRYYESEGDVAVADSGRARSRTTGGTVTASRKQRLVLAFDMRGELVEGARQLGGETAAMDSTQVSGVRARAAELQRQEATPPSPSPGSVPKR